MPLATGYTDATVSATTHAAHHNAIATEVNGSVLPSGGRYASVAARDAAIPSPAAGMIAYTPATGPFMYSAAGVWVPLPGTQVALLKASAAQTTVSGTVLNINLPTDTYLPFSQASRAAQPSRYLLPYPGRYRAVGSCSFSNLATGAYRFIFLNLNTTAIPGSIANVYQAGSTNPAGHSITDVSANGTTDYLTLSVQCNAVVDTFLSASHWPTLSVVYLGPDY